MKIDLITQNKQNILYFRLKKMAPTTANQSEEKKAYRKRKGKKSYERIEVKKKKRFKIEKESKWKFRIQNMRAKRKLETSKIVTSDDPLTSLQKFGKALKRFRVALPWWSWCSSETVCEEKSAAEANYCK